MKIIKRVALAYDRFYDIVKINKYHYGLLVGEVTQDKFGKIFINRKLWAESMTTFEVSMKRFEKEAKVLSKS